MIDPTTDYDFVIKVALNDEIWPWISDDCGVKENYIPDERMLYLKISDDSKDVGFFSISCHNSVLFEIHTAILPEFWGKSLKYSTEVIGWIFGNTACQKLMTFVPENNNRALVFAERSGLKKEAFIADSFLKGGNLIGQHILSISRGDVCLLQQQ